VKQQVSEKKKQMRSVLNQDSKKGSKKDG